MNTAPENEAARGRTGKVLIFLAKLTVSGVLIGFLLKRMTLTEIRLAMESPHWGWLTASFVVYGLSAFGGALQWSWILRVAGISAPPREIRRLYFIGLFFNNFLPANIGGDAYKIVDLGRKEGRPHGVFCATLLDRLIGLSALTSLGVLVLTVVSVAEIPLPVSVLLLIPVLVILALTLAFLLSRRIGRQLPGLFLRLKMVKLAGQLEKITDEFGLYRPKVRWLNGIFLFSLGVQFLRLSTHLLVALGLGFSLGWDQALQLLVLIPVLAISLTLPVTINGIGLRESVSARLLTHAGLGEGQAVAMEVAAYLVQVVFSLQGGILLWLGNWGRSSRTGN
ncbi:MAG: lysylphosphatidylglycerol synthase transmembrane domain-containing protein [Candidatus Krumholzibacteriota bacterium]